MIKSIFPNVKALILDMDGVLWRGSEPIGDLPALFARTEELGYKVLFATNNSTGTIDFLHKKLLDFGIQNNVDQIINSSLALAHLLEKIFPDGGPVYILGESGLVNPLQKANFFHATKDVLAVVVGLDRELTYAKLREANFLIRAGIPFFGTNPDRTFPSPEGITPGAGSILAALEASSGVKPEIIGKPYPYLFQTALGRLGTLPEETLVVGDRLDTDILGGFRTGCRTALVLSGVTTHAELHHWKPQPDLVAVSLTELLE
jgi:4-nitrophenyl phosphatase